MALVARNDATTRTAPLGAPAEGDGDLSAPGARAGAHRVLLPALVAIALIAKAALTRGLALGDPGLGRTLLLEAPLLLLLVWAVHALTRTRRGLHVTALLVTDAVVSISLLATAVYATYFGQLLTFDMLGLAGQATEVTDSISELLRPVHALYAIDLPVLLAVALLPASLMRWRPPVTPRVQTRAVVVMLAALVLGSSMALVGAWKVPQPANSIAAAGRHGIAAYQLASLHLVVAGEPDVVAVDEAASRELAATIATLRAGRTGPRIADFQPGAYGGANLIVVQVEALQTLLIDLEVDGVEVTPELNKIAAESWYFPRTHAQLARGNTSDAEFVMNSGLYPPPNQAASVRWGAKRVPALPRVLAEHGYYSLTLHQNEARFWNRTNLYPALGFDRWYDRSEVPPDPWWQWGAPDSVLFDVAHSAMTDLRAEERPFYAQIITMTSHFPFHHPPEEYRPFKPGEPFAGTPVGAYMSSVSYTDRVIGEFVDALKRDGLWDESIVVFYGDHFGLLRPSTAEEAALLEELLGHPYTDVDYLRVPLMVHLPGQTEGRVVDTTLGQVDIFATLADPLGLDLTHVPQFGRSAFAGGDGLIGMRGLIPFGSMLNERVLFQPGLGFDDGTSFDVRTGEPTATVAADRADYDLMTELLRLASEYTDGLPVRADADRALGDAIIPNRETVSTETPDP